MSADKEYRGLRPEQVEGLEEAYKKIEALENEVKTMKETMLTKEEFAALIKSSGEAYKAALNGEIADTKLTTT